MRGSFERRRRRVIFNETPTLLSWVRVADLPMHGQDNLTALLGG